MAAGVIDVICNQNLPTETAPLVNFLRTCICRGTLEPFYGVLNSQNGVVQADPEKALTPLEIVSMDWLAENVIGKIPDIDELTDAAKAVVLLQGIDQQKSEVAETIGGVK